MLVLVEHTVPVAVAAACVLLRVLLFVMGDHIGTSTKSINQPVDAPINQSTKSNMATASCGESPSFLSIQEACDPGICRCGGGCGGRARRPRTPARRGSSRVTRSGARHSHGATANSRPTALITADRLNLLAVRALYFAQVWYRQVFQQTRDRLVTTLERYVQSSQY